ncbi:unnamed protein product [Knipowitschia caucasica]
MSTDQTLRVFIKEKNIETPYFEMKEELEEESIKQEEEQLPVDCQCYFCSCNSLSLVHLDPLLCHPLIHM